MGRGWKFWVLIAALVVGHFVLHVGLGLDAAAAPDLLVVALLLGARRLGGAGAAALGLALGLLEDALSLSVFGAAAVTDTLVGYLGARSRDLFFGDSLVFVAAYVFLGKWVHDAVYYVLARSSFREGAVEVLLVQAPLAGLYAAGVAIAVLLLYGLVSGER